MIINQYHFMKFMNKQFNMRSRKIHMIKSLNAIELIQWSLVIKWYNANRYALSSLRWLQLCPNYYLINLLIEPRKLLLFLSSTISTFLMSISIIFSQFTMMEFKIILLQIRIQRKELTSFQYAPIVRSRL